MSDEKHHEIVIIKRVSGGHEDGHHGGAWKIAFADFMTAMMAFFLVMWLISASDKTKAVIAHYFNPVQLVDSTPQPKGLQDLKADAQSVMKYSNAQNSDHPSEKDQSSTTDAKAVTETNATAQNKNTEPDKTAKHEAELFRDPYAVLAEIAAKSDAHPPRESKKTSSEGTKGGSGAVGLKGGEAYRDPFEPMPLPPTETLNPEDLKAVQSLQEAMKPNPVVPPRTESKATKESAAPKDGLGVKADSTKTEGQKPEAPKADSSTPQQEAQAAAIRAKIEAMTQPVPGTGAAMTPEPKVDVHRTSEGLVIGLTDDDNFAMFASASAEPSPRMVLLMEKIGRLLKTEKGAITIRGFTDNKPFKSDAYDNWRLSSARADMAHYMLVRGGLDDQRIDRIEGYADRRPKNPKDPGSAENRRIEILLRESTP